MMERIVQSDNSFEPSPPLVEITAPVPEIRKQPCKTERPLGVLSSAIAPATTQRPFQRRTKVIVLNLHKVQTNFCLWRCHLRLQLLSQFEEVVQVPIAYSFSCTLFQ